MNKYLRSNWKVAPIFLHIFIESFRNLAIFSQSKVWRKIFLNPQFKNYITVIGRIRVKNLYYFGHLKENCPANSQRKIVLSDRKMQDSLTKRYEKIKFFPPKMRFYVQGIVKGEKRIPHSWRNNEKEVEKLEGTV